jgi:hypothetical protein
MSTLTARDRNVKFFVRSTAATTEAFTPLSGVDMTHDISYQPIVHEPLIAVKAPWGVGNPFGAAAEKLPDLASDLDAMLSRAEGHRSSAKTDSLHDLARQALAAMKSRKAPPASWSRHIAGALTDATD